MLRDSIGVVEAEHFEAHSGTAPHRDETPDHFGLQAVMVGIIMPLAEEDEISASQMGNQSLSIDEYARGDVPNTSGERMITTQWRFP